MEESSRAKGGIYILVSTWKSSVAGLYKGIDPQKVADEIAQIGYSATPAQIVDKARDEGAELHKCFEWNDSKAAERWRIQQARQIACSLVIRETDDQAQQKPEIRVFYKTDSSSGYKPTTLIYQDRSEYQKLLARAISELSAFKSKYKSLAELDKLFEVIDELAG